MGYSLRVLLHSQSFFYASPAAWPTPSPYLCEQDQERSYDRQAGVVTAAGPSSVPPQGAAERSAAGGNAAPSVPQGVGVTPAAPSELALLASAANQGRGTLDGEHSKGSLSIATGLSCKRLAEGLETIHSSPCEPLSMTETPSPALPRAV